MSVYTKLTDDLAPASFWFISAAELSFSSSVALSARRNLLSNLAGVWCLLSAVSKAGFSCVLLAWQKSEKKIKNEELKIIVILKAFSLTF